MSGEDDLRLRIEIDAYRLDDEWLEQPKHFLKWCERLAEKRLQLDQVKSKLDIVKAELDSEIRENPGEFDLPKVTESAVANTVVTQPEYRKAVENLNKARYEQNLAQAAVDALEQRKKALENLVSLHGMQYFAELREPKGREEEVRDSQKKKVRTMWSKKRAEDD